MQCHEITIDYMESIMYEVPKLNDAQNYVIIILSHTKSHTHILAHIAGKFGKLTLFEPLAKKVWRINRSANRLLIVSSNLA